jgi:hypothetical protein
MNRAWKRRGLHGSSTTDVSLSAAQVTTHAFSPFSAVRFSRKCHQGSNT